MRRKVNRLLPESYSMIFAHFLWGEFRGDLWTTRRVDIVNLQGHSYSSKRFLIIEEIPTAIAIWVVHNHTHTPPTHICIGRFFIASHLFPSNWFSRIRINWRVSFHELSNSDASTFFGIYSHYYFVNVPTITQPTRLDRHLTSRHRG